MTEATTEARRACLEAAQLLTGRADREALLEALAHLRAATQAIRFALVEDADQRRAA